MSGRDDCSSAPLTGTRDSGRLVLVVAHLAGIYLAVPVQIGNVEVPMVSALVTVPLLLLVNLHRVRLATLGPILGLVAVAIVSIVLAPQPAEYVGIRIKGLAQFCFSLVAAYALVLELSGWRRRHLARLCLAGAILILAGCILENYGGLRPVSNQFRNAVFPTAHLQFVERDIEVAGIERPRLFTSEPSDVAKFLVLLLFGWVALARTPLRHLATAVMGLVGLWLIRSPIVLLLLPLQSALLAWGRPSLPARRLVSRPSAVLLVAIGASFMVSAMLHFVASRFSLALSGGDLSSVIRVVTPVLIAWETLAASPLVGAGISGSESIVNVVLRSYESSGMGALALAALDAGPGDLANQITNSFWLLWINFGLLGGLAVILLLDRWFMAMGARHRLLAFSAVFLFSHTMGAMHGPYFWSFVAFTVAVIAHIDEIGPLALRAPTNRSPLLPDAATAES